MRILFLAHRIPYPPNKGDKIRSYNILNYLSKHHEVHLVTLIDDPKDTEYVSKLSELVQTVAFDIINPHLKKLISAFGIIKSRSISVSYFYSEKVQRAVDRLLERLEFDALICSSSPMAEYVFNSSRPREKLKKLLWLMDLIDVDSFKWQQYAERCSGIKRWIYHREAKVLSDYENKIVSEFDHVLLVSEEERQLFLKTLSASNLSTMSNGVDLEYFNPRYEQRLSKNGPVLVFTGVMDYWPNVEGVKWFVSKVFPRVQHVFPNATFFIVGSRPSKEVQCLVRNKGVRVTGYVDDVRDYIAMADVCLVPLHIARGVQNKVLEALAMGKAVVCTPQALEGLKAVAGKDVIVAEDENQFADCTIRLIKDQKSRSIFGTNARICVENGYSWSKNLSILGNIIASKARKSGGAW